MGLQGILNRYINNISALQFFQLLRYGVMIVTGILFTKSHLHISDIGIFESLILLSGVFSFFWLSGIINSLLSQYHDNKENKDRKSLLFSAFLLISFFSLLAFLSLQLFSTPILKLLGKQSVGEYYNLFSWFILLNTPSFLIEYIFLLQNKAGAIIRYGIVIFGLQLLLVVPPAFITGNIRDCLYGLFTIAVIKFIYLLILIGKYGKWYIDTSLIKKHLIIASPLIISTLLSGSAEYIDGIIVSNLYGISGFALYQYGAKELPFTLLLANAMSSAMIPYFQTERLSTCLKTLRQKSLNLMHVLFPLSVVLMLTSSWFYPIVFNAHFRESAEIFNLFLLLIIPRLVFPQTILVAMKETRIILLASGIELIVNIASSILLLKPFGLAGVAMGTIIAYSVEKVILIFYCSSRMNIHVLNYIPLRQFFIYSSILTFSYFLSLIW